VIELIVLDVDGCLTDGKIIYTGLHEETKAFNVKDGLAIRTWIRMGKQVAIITGRTSDVVARRAKELGVQHLHQGIKDKLTLLKEICDTEKIPMTNVAALGDDLNDYKMLKMVGDSYTPSNGAKPIRAMVSTVLVSGGGEGAAREMIESIVEANGETDAFMAFWI